MRGSKGEPLDAVGQPVVMLSVEVLPSRRKKRASRQLFTLRQPDEAICSYDVSCAPGVKV